MNVEERQHHILALPRGDGEVAVGTPAGGRAVAAETIRRDLRHVEHQGLLQGTHGGAYPVAAARSETTRAVRNTPRVPGGRRIVAAALPVTRHRRVLGVAREVTCASEAWLRDHPIVKRPSVTAACGLVSAVAMPSLAVPELDLLTRWWLWIFGVDDVLDDMDVPDEPVTAWVRRFLRDLPTGPDEGDPLRAAFGSVHHDLRGYPLYALLGEGWRTGMTDIVRGMLLERRWSGMAAADQPSYETYLDNATTTISVRPYTLTAAILAGEPAAVGGLPALDPMIRAAARCFRLANDLRSDARERAEGKLNAVSLLQRAYVADGLGEAAAGQAARERLCETCAADLAYLDSARRTVPQGLATLARFLWAHTSFVWDMYQIGDYDTLSALLRGESGF
ncbi:MAG TPA: DeoR family transcriptional regulator [Pilimelia sp.]|nr:DeoR family transcriptional regulator [Pilimelia sp.]